ncbi:MAG: DNA gyrase subunit A, partial [Candidatus Firestonebacteria bacterium]
MTEETKKTENIELPTKTGGRVIPVYIEDEMKNSYIDYAMSVIVGRALPDARDGLKPVHRRILYAMNEMGLNSNKPHRKSAKVVGEVLGNYHPHGDVAVYDTMVRLAQDFSCRYPLVDGQGNFGSIDGDPPAAMRYTEVRLSKIAEELLVDIDKDTVDFVPNYDESRFEPSILPAKLPNLLLNGSSGIAVGMATNIPPHSLSELIDGIIAMIDNPNITIEELMTKITGPDFPGGGYILGKQGIIDAYRTGRGSIVMQAKAYIETTKKDRERIIVTELPYQVNKATLIETIAGMVRDKKIEGISDIRDESDREGMRIVIEVKRDENANVLLNQLLKSTSMRSNFGVIMLALVDGQPRVLNLRKVLHCYIEHRKDVIIKRTKFELDKAQRRAHILEGLKIAIKFLNEIIKLIRSSKNVDEARQSLIKKYKLTIEQAQAILDMRLQQLTALERDKIEQEYQELLKRIEQLKMILSSHEAILNLIKEEILEIKNKYGDKRRTEIIQKAEEIKIEDLIAEEEVVVTLSHNGYIKRIPSSVYKQQRRGGKGVMGMETRDEDFVEDLFITTTHNHILFFTNLGKVYWLKVYEIPEGGRYTKGKAIINLLKVEKDEAITVAIAVKEFKDDVFFLMATKCGVIKRVELSAFSNPRSTGLIAIKLREKDELIAVKLTSGKEDVVLATRKGKAIRFNAEEIREIGRTGVGVRGIRLGKDDYTVGMEIVKENATLLTVTENGYG